MQESQNSANSRKEKLELLALLEEQGRRRRENSLRYYNPYEKQREFHRAGARYKERLFMAGNQLGKSVSGAAEVAAHLTGEYPDWWEGKRFDRPIRAMCGSESNALTIKGIQRNLVGPPEIEEDYGTGMLPKSSIVKYLRKPGVPNGLESITVRHKSGGTSVMQFNSYDQGRSKWQADTVDLVWFDEEPPEDLYMEGLTRVSATGGIIMVTFTPLLGMSNVVKRFYPNTEYAQCTYVNMTLRDVGHYSMEQIESIEAQYPPHEREARLKGLPALGSGRVFPVAESAVTVEPFSIPAHWPRIVGIDFGWDHPFAAAWLAWDRDSDIVYVTDCYREREVTPIIHAAAIKPRGPWIPVAWPHDGLQHDKGSGESLAIQYRNQGLNMLDERAKFEDGTNSVEAGIMLMLERMQTGRLKVFSHLGDWFQEMRLYHRDDGKIVKKDDDLMSATRYGIMELRSAITKPKPTKMTWSGTSDNYAGY